MRNLFVLLPLTLLAACAGYAIDYAKPKTSIIGPQLVRYGMSGAPAACLSDRLGAQLSVWQLRQLEIATAARSAGWYQPGRLTPRDFLHVAAHVEDRRVGPLVAAATEACAVPLAPLRRAEAAPPPPPQQPQPSPDRAPAAQAAPVWINLGAAPSGQSIAVDASSVAQDALYRSAWFRLTDPGQSRPNPAAYLLRIDCQARTINAMKLRKYNPAGGLAEERDHGPAGEGAIAVEAGTVMEIAFLSLCS